MPKVHGCTEKTGVEISGLWVRRWDDGLGEEVPGLAVGRRCARRCGHGAHPDPGTAVLTPDPTAPARCLHPHCSRGRLVPAPEGYCRGENKPHGMSIRVCTASSVPKN